MEHNMMTVKDVAEYMRLSEQTIQRYVLNKEIPYHKVKKVIRFRFSEIEMWINGGGGACRISKPDDREGDLFAGLEAGGIGAAEPEAESAAGEGSDTGEVKA
jgi:excisionase family DNA binding protein